MPVVAWSEFEFLGGCGGQVREKEVQIPVPVDRFVEVPTERTVFKVRVIP